MSVWRARLAAPGPGTELAFIVALIWLTLASIPLLLGGIGLSWDGLNHHIYLGWVADQPRFDRDFLAASYQSYTYPYLYWPAYKLFAAGASGTVAGLVLVSLHVLVLPALWLIARVCVPGTGWYAVGMRSAAVLLGISGQLFLSLLDNTANDGLAAIPFVWAVALALSGTSADLRPNWLTTSRCVALSGLLGGLSVAFKFSNGPIALVLPLLWLPCGTGWRQRTMNVALGCICTLVGFGLAYGYWGMLLWRHFGNPVYPFELGWLAPMRGWATGNP